MTCKVENPNTRDCVFIATLRMLEVSALCRYLDSARYLDYDVNLATKTYSTQERIQTKIAADGEHLRSSSAQIFHASHVQILGYLVEVFSQVGL